MLNASSYRLFDDSTLEASTKLIREICQHAGSHDIFENARQNLTDEGITRAVRHRDSAAIFDWLMRTVSYQGISDYVASAYMQKNGTASYREIQRMLSQSGTCQKLQDFFSYNECRYEKSKSFCSNKKSLSCCPVPLLPLRNGRLNQTAFSLFFFVRDVARGDLVAWIDNNSAFDSEQRASIRLSSALGAVFGISDKVASLALSGLLIACSSFRPRWGKIGAQMVVVDTLVHNFLHRTGILRRLGAEHTYGPGCYLDSGCSDVLRALARNIDVQRFNPDYPSDFPRFVQQAIWRFCAELELDICNGRRIDDRHGCRQASCAVFELCSREPFEST